MTDNRTTESVEKTEFLNQTPTTYDNQSRYHRNARIGEKRRKGATYKEIAAEYAISISRVRQIVESQKRRRIKMLQQVNAPLRHAT